MIRNSYQKGFSLLEVIIVVAIIGILAAIAYPNYQDYVMRTNRADMMGELQNMGSVLESRKLAAGRGGYRNVSTNGLATTYPQSGTALYNISINDLQTGRWTIEAVPVAGTTQAYDGTLSLRFDGQKCRGTKCGMGDEWKEE